MCNRLKCHGKLSREFWLQPISFWILILVLARTVINIYNMSHTCLAVALEVTFGTSSVCDATKQASFASGIVE